MKWTSLNDLREAYLSFFESKGHLRLKSFSLVPHNDNSLLLINSGMAPMKPYFKGTEEPPRKRVTTCQKCIRTPDLENVGKTARHGTYFEMLGNFSFGDYFKNEAIQWAWEFLTVTLEIPADLLWPSIYEEDEEAFEIWTKVVGVPAQRVVRMGKADNFWEHGSGPCGPCSEIYFDRGEKYGCGSPDCRPGCECDRYMEIWNNVFSQFDNDGHGNYTELCQKNIDTGMGLERLACVMQGVDNLFEVDTVRKILDTVCSLSGKVYGKEYASDVSIRIITDHIRSSTFMISDGVMPSNEGRGYVLRRLIRRAARHGRLIGIKGAFLSTLADVVIECNQGAYPELKERQDYIKKILSIEEERFDATIDSGLNILSAMVDELKKNNKTVLSGEDAFKLYDTFGFPVDLTREIIAEDGLTLDDKTFSALMTEQKERARAGRKAGGGWDNTTATLAEGIEKTEFLGYTDTECDATVVAIFKDGEKCEAVMEGEATIVFDRTVFYGEGGGQVGDSGKIVANGNKTEVVDTKKQDSVYFHECNVNALISVGDKVTLVIDKTRRDAIRRNHSTAHMLQSALRHVLGEHVEQAGSLVDENRVRFDFKHFAPMTKEEIKKVEDLVNEYILSASAVETIETDPETAKKMGAMALFGEKYGSVVRLVKMGDVSMELCAGTHLKNTAEAGLFRVLSESSVAAGIRRIEGTTGTGVLSLMEDREKLLQECMSLLKVNDLSTVLSRINALTQELKDTKSELDSLRSKMAAAAGAALENSILKTDKFSLLFGEIKDAKADVLRSEGDRLREKYPDIVGVIYSVNDGKIVFSAFCGKDALEKGAHAGNILKTISPIVGGGGGGRPDSASSGGRDVTKLPEAKKTFEEMMTK
ncbi:MAG: alanine--tRNA ligase [Ruminococcaceae bacterium]|nr:alanine--tRNA ligase [Oscillospiraceae bacterium]